MVSVNINGKTYSFTDDEQMPLLWALRDIFKLKGTKFGCGQGLCGACTVHVDGLPTRACVTTVASIKGKKITTIEGLSEQGEHPLQQAWQALNVPQCGYCQSGQLMSAAALLAQNAQPNDQDIDNAMNGNICRCGTYPRIKQAIHQAADALAIDKSGA